MAIFNQQAALFNGPAQSGHRLQLAAALAVVSLSLGGCATKGADQPIGEPDFQGIEDIAIVTGQETERASRRTAALERGPSEIVLRDNAPESYIVQQRDTLWDIAAHFLEDPYTWPEIWHQNQQIQDPHLIFPGDEIRLIMVDGKPVLSINRGDQGTTILQPRVREVALEQAAPVIAADLLRNFDAQPRVVTKRMLNSAPYVLANTEGRVISAAPDSIYVRGITSQEDSMFNIVRPNKPLIDPDTNELLGYEALNTGVARVDQFGDPSTLRLVKTSREVLRGDRLAQYEGEPTYRDLKPVLLKNDLQGKVISFVNALSKAGQYQIIVFNRGAEDGLQVGTMVELMGREQQIFDKEIDPKDPELVTLPSQRKGVAIVVQAFDWVSYAMILEATSPIDLYDGFTGF